MCSNSFCKIEHIKGRLYVLKTHTSAGVRVTQDGKVITLHVTRKQNKIDGFFNTICNHCDDILQKFIF